MTSGRMLTLRTAAGLAIAATLSACELAKSANPTAPSVAGPIAGVNIAAPALVEPNGATIPVDAQPVTLVVGNVTTNSQRTITYSFQVAVDANFSTLVFTRDGVPQVEGDKTSIRLPDALATGRSYYWRARAGDGANTGPFSGAARFDIYTPKSLDKPVLLAPTNNEPIASTRPTFRWINAPRSGPIGAIKYTIEIADVESFARTVAVWQVGEQPTQTSYVSPQDWERGLYLFWRVRASSTDGGDEGPWSDPRAFLIQRIAIGKPNLVSPANNEVIGGLSPTFVWDNAPKSGPAGAVTYTVEVSDVESFGNKLAVWQVPEQSGQTRYQSPQNWAYDQYLFWRVRGTDGQVTGDWAVTRAFKMPGKPAPPPASSGGGGGGGPVNGDWRSCGSTPGDKLVECVHAAVNPAHTPEGAFEVVKRVAWLLRGGGAGLLIKNGGENIVSWKGYSFSASRICYPDGHIFKVLSDVPATNGPSWSDNSYVDRSLYVPAIDPGS